MILRSDGIAWDVIAIYARSVRFGPPSPRPVLAGSTVVEQARAVARFIAAP